MVQWSSLGDYPSLGFWLGLSQNPGELLGLVCVCRFCAGEGNCGPVHLPRWDQKGPQGTQPSLTQFSPPSGHWGSRGGRSFVTSAAEDVQ